MFNPCLLIDVGLSRFRVSGEVLKRLLAAFAREVEHG
jgi:hypothetical protein